MNRIFRIATLVFAISTLATGQIASSAVGAPTDKGSGMGERSTLPAATTGGPTPKVGDDFVIGTEDLLSINVWREAELSRTVQVRPDGKISLPLVGEVVASGLTPRELQDRLSKDLEKFISHPEVTVIVQEVRSQKFNIVGQVNRPGTFTLVKPMTVLDALAQAGGFGTFATLKDIYVLRTSANGTRVRLPFNYRKVIKGQNVEQNIQLESHDTIVVP